MPMILKKRKSDDDDDEPVKAKKSSAASTDEDFGDDDFFSEGEAAEWVNEHKAPEQRYKPEFYVSKKDEERNKIILLDTKPAFTLLVHTVHMGGKNYPKLTCVRAVRPCPFCEVAAKGSAIGTSYSVFVWRVWSYGKWTDKDGNTHWVSRKFWVLPKASSDTLSKTLKKYGSRALETMFEVVKGTKDKGFSLVPTELTEKQQTRIDNAGDHFTKDEFRDIYKPVSDKEMQGIIKSLTRNKKSESFDDDDE